MAPAASPPQPPVFPPAPLLAYIGSVAGAGVLANCALIFSLLRRFRPGLNSILTQFAIVDLVLIVANISPEVWCYNFHGWCFGAPAWVLHCGLKSFSNAAALYFTMTVSFHALASAATERKSTKRRAKNTTEDEEVRSSRHSLVASSDSSTPPRTMNVEYRTASASAPIALPSILVWTLAVSVSIPEFVLAARAVFEDEIDACNNINSARHIHIVYSSLTALNTFVPLAMLCVVCICVIVKLSTRRRTRGTVQRDDSTAALRLSLCFLGAFALLCTPHILFSAYQTYRSEVGVAVGMTDLSLSCLRLAAPLVRPLSCFAALPRLRRVFIGTKDLNGDLV